SGPVSAGIVLKPIRGVASARQIVALVRPDVAERLAVRTVLDVLVARAARLEPAYGDPPGGGGAARASACSRARRRTFLGPARRRDSGRAAEGVGLEGLVFGLVD